MWDTFGLFNALLEEFPDALRRAGASSPAPTPAEGIRFARIGFPCAADSFPQRGDLLLVTHDALRPGWPHCLKWAKLERVWGNATSENQLWPTRP